MFSCNRSCLHCKKFESVHVFGLVGKCGKDGSVKLSISEACDDIELHDEVVDILNRKEELVEA